MIRQTQINSFMHSLILHEHAVIHLYNFTYKFNKKYNIYKVSD